MIFPWKKRRTFLKYRTLVREKWNYRKKSVLEWKRREWKKWKKKEKKKEKGNKIRHILLDKSSFFLDRVML